MGWFLTYFSMTLAGLMWILSGNAGLADPKSDLCDLKARKISGYSGTKPLEFNLGSFKGRVSGSVSVGVSRTRGNASAAVTPPFSGAASVEPREQRAIDDYRRAFKDCMEKD